MNRIDSMYHQDEKSLGVAPQRQQTHTSRFRRDSRNVWQRQENEFLELRNEEP